jgi:hypothetical protein
LDELSGKIVLNQAGDRISESYDFWTISKNDHGYEWKRENNDILKR